MSGQSKSTVFRPGSIEWWREALARLNNVFLQAPWLQSFRDCHLPREDVKVGWLGRDGASEAELTELEDRLGMQICPSYRALLQVSNGFARFGEFVGRLLPSNEVNWYAQRNPDVGRMIQEYVQAGHSLKPQGYDPNWSADIALRSIEIAENDIGWVLTLHPNGTNAEGEWEVWTGLFSPDRRYPST